MAGRTQVKQTGGRGKDSKSCTHHWVIAPRNGPTSRAVCKLCRAVRQFRNASDDYVEDGVGRKAV